MCVAGVFHLGARGGCFMAAVENDEQQAEKKCSGPFSVWPLDACEVEERKQVGVVLHRRGVELMQLEKQNTGAQV